MNLWKQIFQCFSLAFKKTIIDNTIEMIENWKTQLNKRNKIGVTIMDLTKVFDTLNHNQPVAKLKAYGLDLSAALFIKSYLTNKYQRCKIGDSFSELERIITGVPQGPILGPILFNIFINDIFLYIENSDLCNYADGSSFYAFGNSLSIIIGNLTDDFLRISKWFHKYFMILNHDKCHFMVLGDSNCTFHFTCNGTTIGRCKDRKF